MELCLYLTLELMRRRVYLCKTKHDILMELLANKNQCHLPQLVLGYNFVALNSANLIVFLNLPCVRA